MERETYVMPYKPHGKVLLNAKAIMMMVRAFRTTNIAMNIVFDFTTLGFIKIYTVYNIATIAAPRKFPCIIFL